MEKRTRVGRSQSDFGRQPLLAQAMSVTTVSTAPAARQMADADLVELTGRRRRRAPAQRLIAAVSVLSFCGSPCRARLTYPLIGTDVRGRRRSYRCKGRFALADAAA